MSNNSTLKFVIIGSLLLLILASAGIGLYVWNMDRQNTATSNTSATKSTTSVAKQESVKTGTVTQEMLDSDGTVNLTKVLQGN